MKLHTTLTATLVLLLTAQSYARDIVFSSVYLFSFASLDPAPNMYSRNPEKFAEFLCFVWRLVQVICVVLLVVDVISRMRGKALYFIHTSRFIITAFGLSSLIFTGLFYGPIRATRNYMTIHLAQFVDDMYANFFGWRLPSNTDVFNAPAEQLVRLPPLDIFMFVNVTFIEEVILFILLITWGIMKLVLKKEAIKNKIYHFVKSLFLVFLISFMFPLIFWAGMFWRTHVRIGEFRNPGEASRSYFGYIVNWIIMFFWLFICLGPLAYMAKTSLQSLDSDQTIETEF